MLSDEWLQRYRLLENFTAKWNGNGNGNAYDRGDYNSSFALRAVELKSRFSHDEACIISLVSKSEIGSVSPASVAVAYSSVQSQTWSETRKTDFPMTKLHMTVIVHLQCII